MWLINNDHSCMYGHQQTAKGARQILNDKGNARLLVDSNSAIAQESKKNSLKNVSGIGTTSGKQGLGELDTDNKEVPLARQRTPHHCNIYLKCANCIQESS